MSIPYQFEKLSDGSRPTVVTGITYVGYYAAIMDDGVECVLIAPTMGSLEFMWNRISGGVIPMDHSMVQKVIMGAAKNAHVAEPMTNASESSKQV